MTNIEPKARFLSVDVMRGLTLALMIIVNMSLSEELAYSQLLHSAWHGFTLTDLVFPTFLFVVGASMGIRLDKFEGFSNGTIIAKILVRSILIFACGFFVSNFPFFRLVDGSLIWTKVEDLRILGVLQRIGICYAIAALIIQYWKIRGAVIFMPLALIGYYLIMACFGDFSLEGNAALKVDLSILGASHLYKGEGIPFDPEGILGILPSVVNVLAGYLAAVFLRKKSIATKNAGKLILSGLVLVVLANISSIWFPINKKIWTSSYVLLNIGIDLVFLGILVYFIEIKRHLHGTYYFEVLGKNTLAIYILAELAMGLLWTIPVNDASMMTWIYNNLFGWIGGKLSGLIFAICFMQTCWFAAYFLDKRKIYIKL